jgi:hypothetical protein
MSYVMSNEELAAAIAYAFKCCDQPYVGGYNTSTTESGKVMLNHLKTLTEIQRTRAAVFEPYVCDPTLDTFGL